MAEWRPIKWRICGGREINWKKSLIKDKQILDSNMILKRLLVII